MGETFAPRRLQKFAIPHQWHIVEEQTLLLDRAAVGGHRSRRDASHVGVVTTAGHKRHKPTFPEHRRDQREIRQVGAAVVGVVGHHSITGPQRFTLTALHRLEQRQHALPHRAEVHGDVRGVGNELAARVKQRAGEIQPLTDIHRCTGLLQSGAHLLSDRHEAMAEQLQADRIQP